MKKKSHDTTLLIRASLSLMRLKVAAIICGGVIKPLCDFLDMPEYYAAKEVYVVVEWRFCYA